MKDEEKEKNLALTMYNYGYTYYKCFSADGCGDEGYKDDDDGGFLTSSSATTLYCGRVPRLTSATQRQSGETITSVLTGHIILTPTQSVASGQPQRGSNP